LAKELQAQWNASSGDSKGEGFTRDDAYSGRT
jgi:hypothetical protein